MPLFSTTAALFKFYFASLFFISWQKSNYLHIYKNLRYLFLLQRVIYLKVCYICKFKDSANVLSNNQNNVHKLIINKI